VDNRVFGVFTDGFQSAENTSWLGKGIGMGSNVAAVLTTGTPDFLLAEMEWARVVLEFDPIFGLGFMIFRVFLSVHLVNTSFRAVKRGESLGWMLVPATVPLLVMTAMEQPTYLGFMVFGAGLCLAAGRECPSFSRQSDVPPISVPPEIAHAPAV
jgi:hypothetical protein